MKLKRRDDSAVDEFVRQEVRVHARRLLEKADALGRLPTPVPDLVEAAKLVLGPHQAVAQCSHSPRLKILHRLECA